MYKQELINISKQLGTFSTELENIKKQIKDEEMLLKCFSQKKVNTAVATGRAATVVGQAIGGGYTFYKATKKFTEKKKHTSLMFSGAAGFVPAFFQIGFGAYSHKDKVNVNNIYIRLIKNLQEAFNSLPKPMVFLGILNKYQPKKANFAYTSNKALLVSKYSSLWSITNSSLEQIKRLNKQIDYNLHRQIRCFATISRIFEGDGAKTIDMAMACRTWIIGNLAYELLSDGNKLIQKLIDAIEALVYANVKKYAQKWRTAVNNQKNNSDTINPQKGSSPNEIGSFQIIHIDPNNSNK